MQLKDQNVLFEALKDSKPTAFVYLLLGAAFGILFQSLNVHWIYGVLKECYSLCWFSQL